VSFKSTRIPPDVSSMHLSKLYSPAYCIGIK
jgi:hypothetical protein